MLLNKRKQYWITPIGAAEDKAAIDIISLLVGEKKIYAFRKSTVAANRVKKGDWMCFYAIRKGIIGYAQVASEIRANSYSNILDTQKYPRIVDLEQIDLFLNTPIIIDEDMRTRLDAFDTERKIRIWAWFVTAMHSITEHDFYILIGEE